MFVFVSLFSIYPDDYGRTPLHDAAWTDQPNFEIVQQLLENSPDLLLVKDKRGYSPLAYVPSQQRAEWCRFLEEHEEFIEAAIESKFTLSA
jgi:ankyrin repeat protein